jgi:hypothetical protein
MKLENVNPNGNNVVLPFNFIFNVYLWLVKILSPSMSNCLFLPSFEMI